MTPGARIQAAIEVLDAIGQGTQPADHVATAYFRGRRYIGSGDRAAIGGMVYGVLRKRAQLDWWIARASSARIASRTRVIAYLALVEGTRDLDRHFDGDRYRPVPMGEAELVLTRNLPGREIDQREQPPLVRANLPEWLEPALRARFGDRLMEEAAALAEEAPLDLRANPLRASRAAALKALVQEGLHPAPTPLSPLGLRLPKRVPLQGLKSFEDGLVEVQDEGSQLAALLVGARAGMRVCDFCAGAGGKTLAIAATMENKGHVVACDVSTRRLEWATKRLRRAGAFNVEQVKLADERDKWVKRHRGKFDRVLVDAPCTGTGTWRRNPDGRWSLSREELTRLVALQASILDSAARLVKPGGRLIYVTCSLLPEEDEAQAEAFASAHPDFAPLPMDAVWAETIGGAAPAAATPYLLLTPARHGTDGFFVAAFARREEAAAAPPAAP